MDNERMIKRLKEVGISFENGLSEGELAAAENTFGFAFPVEIRDFLACGLPVGDRFFNWRDLSDANVQSFRDFQLFVERHFAFDLKENCDDLRELLAEQFPETDDSGQFAEAVLDYLHHSTKLIPFYAHRCFFDGMDHMPIVSFWQPVDSVFYGKSFEDYLETEFLGKKHSTEPLSERIKDTGIWYYLIGK